MKAKNIKQMTIAAALAGCAATAQAGFVPVSNVASGLNTIDIVSNNNFRPNLSSLGVKQYTLGGSLTTDVAGTVTYYYYGKEAGYQNLFGAWDSDAVIDHVLTYDSGFAPNYQNNFAAPVLIGSVDAGAGAALNFGFCANSAPGVSVGCVTNQLNDWFGLGSQQSIAFSAAGNLAWIFWDDSGAGPDDNHDDMLIKAVFTPRSVPEPATLGLFGLGLLGVWVAGRRRARKS